MDGQHAPGSAPGMPANMYRTDDRLMVAALMPGLVSSKDITVEITAETQLILHADQRGSLKDDVGPLERKQTLLEEWSAGPYHRELKLPSAVDGELATVTYGNGVLVVALPLSKQTRPARLRLEAIGPFRAERVGSAGHPIKQTTTAEHQAAQASIQAEHGGPIRRGSPPALS